MALKLKSDDNRKRVPVFCIREVYFKKDSEPESPMRALKDASSRLKPLPAPSPEEEVIGEDDETPVDSDHCVIDPKKKVDIEIIEIKGDELQDAWFVEEDRVVRYHRISRDRLFSPRDGDCPIPVEMLSSERLSDYLTDAEPAQLVSLSKETMQLLDFKISLS